MTWNLVDLFGATAAYNGTNKTVTFDVTKLMDAANQPWLSNATPTAAQIFAALLKHAYLKTKDSAADKTKGIVAQATFGESVVIETRDSQSQMYESFTFRAYRLTPTEITSGIDPDNVI